MSTEEQIYYPNKRYEINTVNGWEAFEGIVKTQYTNKAAVEFLYESGNKLVCTDDHKIYSENGLVPASILKVGDKVEADNNQYESIVDISHTSLDTVYDIFNSESHTILANTTNVSQCDELAFVNRRIALEFWTSVFPTLSCLVGGTYVLNPVDGYRRIDSYVEGLEVAKGEYYKVHNEKIWGMSGIENLSHVYISPETETFVITTESGYRVEVTHNHPLYVEGKGMTFAKDIVFGDAIRYDIGMGCFGKRKLPMLFGFKKILSTDLCLSLDLESSNRLVAMVQEHSYNMTTSNSVVLDDYESIYRLKLILANMGYKSVISGNSLYIGEYSSVSNYDYDPVVSIEESVADITYDFTVPESHSFLQNGVMGSNTGGSCIITSTPTDDETLFAHIWKEAENTFDEHGNELEGGVGRNGFSALKVKWDKHPERDDDFKQSMISAFGEEKFQREHELEFVADRETLIAPLTLKVLEGNDPIKTTDSKVRWYKKPDKEFMYLIGFDPSMGTGGDNAAIQVFEFPSMVQVAEWMHNKSDPSVQIRILIGILNGFRDLGFEEDAIWWTFENNGCGDTVNMYLREVEDEEEIFGTLIKEPAKSGKKRPRKGMLTTNQTKKVAFSRMKRWIEKEIMKINSKPLIKELKTFVRSGATYRALLGEKDDLVLAVMLVARMAEKAMGEEEEYVESLGVAQDIVRDLKDDDEGSDYMPLPVA